MKKEYILKKHTEEITPNNSYWVLAYYYFTKIENPQEEVAAHKRFFKDKDATSRIYISEEGINGQMSAFHSDAEQYIEWMRGRAEFSDINFKVHLYHEHAFPRLTIKYRKKLVAIDEQFDLANRGEHVEPARWKAMLESQEEKILIDVRNNYEWEIGHFEGAELPPCNTFREFSSYAEQLKETKDPKKTSVMMYCTGGIRCELYSSILKEKGFDKVYQLDGGVIGYGLKEGSRHWKGKLFVFDDRLSVPISDEEAPVIGKCHHCGEPNENYYNCANMDCNHLFLCCPSCLKANLGCCKKDCLESSRLRPYQESSPHKPFRRWHHYLDPAGQ